MPADKFIGQNPVSQNQIRDQIRLQYVSVICGVAVLVQPVEHFTFLGCQHTLLLQEFGLLVQVVIDDLAAIRSHVPVDQLAQLLGELPAIVTELTHLRDDAVSDLEGEPGIDLAADDHLHQVVQEDESKTVVCLIASLGASPDLGYLDREPVPLFGLLYGHAVPVGCERLHRHGKSLPLPDRQTT